MTHTSDVVLVIFIGLASIVGCLIGLGIILARL